VILTSRDVAFLSQALSDSRATLDVTALQCLRTATAAAGIKGALGGTSKEMGLCYLAFDVMGILELAWMSQD